ncbi:protocadherin-like wing polarity protein stan isoform X2 [Amphibalanus amphitrite]|uniref:protocadherin-like wing polarity protein stan isoform X2 n=1 Tax=Amphibalanus amphitrite TaxID=1232801 RepID=UPI001C91742A|nr:protocadherin-like wing polarity protein stan isoform X2 [Amphibalanus amphitrite]
MRTSLALGLLLQACSLVYGYLVVVPSTTPVGATIFDAGISGSRHYRLDRKRSPAFVQSVVSVKPRSGRLVVLRPLRCDGLFYPNPFLLYIESWTDVEHHVDYVSLAVRVFVVGTECGDSRRIVADQVLQHGSRSAVSVALPVTSTDNKICLRRGQFVVKFRDLLPASAHDCDLSYQRVSDPRLAVERTGHDLVSARDQCVSERLWRVVVYFRLECDAAGHESHDHALMILFHHYIAERDDMLKRIRREMANQSPFFDRPSYVVTVPEGRARGHVVTTLTAKDPEDGPLTYSMVAVLDSRSQTMFDLDPNSGVVTTSIELDREYMSTHYFKVTVSDSAQPPRTGTTTLQVTVEDANDHAPEFEHKEYEASARESTSIGSTVLTVRATDSDMGANAEMAYSILNPQGANEAFRIDSRTGIIKTRLPLDREEHESYTLQVQATDRAPPAERQSATAQVTIRVLDDNDNYPQFSEKSYSVSVPEDKDWTQSPIIARISATDGDAGENARIRYALIGGNTQGHFTIDTETGHVSVVGQLDYETIRNYRLVIRAQDGGSPSRSNTTNLLVNVEDVNDNKPRFYSENFHETVQENVPEGFTIVRVQAFDVDDGANAKVRYSLTGPDVAGMPIEVDESTGWLRTTRQIDREEKHKYEFQVVATDGGTPPLSASAGVLITIQDQNDNDPVFDPKVYETSLSETAPPGTRVIELEAHDPDEASRLHYEITQGNERGRFSIGLQNGKGLIALTQPLDFKLERRYVLKVSATDSGGRSDSATVYINITDANTHPPVFENTPYSVSVLEDAPRGTVVLTVSASDLDSGENARITYELTGEPEAEFAVNPTTGEITTTQQLDRERRSGYLLTVSARDNGQPMMSDTTDVEVLVTDVNDNAPRFDQDSYQASISEDEVRGTSVLTIRASDADRGLNGRVRYVFAEGGDGDGAFTVDPSSGVIRTSRQLDRETVEQYELVALAVDQGAPAMSSSVKIVVDVDDVNDSPPVFEENPLRLFIAENSPIGSSVGKIRAHDPDAGANALVEYSMVESADSASFELRTGGPMAQDAELFTRQELDYESDKKVFTLVILAQSPPLQSYVSVEINVQDVNDNAPTLSNFQVIFNNYLNHFPVGPIGRVPAVDLDATDQLTYTVLSGNNANLLLINSTTGDITLSPSLNTNVRTTATMEISVSDGRNEDSAFLELHVRLVTDKMLFNSVTLRLAEMTSQAFLSPRIFTLFKDGLASVLGVAKEQIIIFNVQDDTDVPERILNVSFSALDAQGAFGGSFDGPFLSQQHIQEKVYLNRARLAKLAAVQVLPFDDDLCVREPCLNFDKCLTVLKFGNASGFVHSPTILFRPIFPVTTFACRCPAGFAGMREFYECDTEVNLCYSQPCQNGGTCQRREGGYTCVCADGFTGESCELDTTRGSCPTDPSDGSDRHPVCHGGSVCVNLQRGGFLCDNCTNSPYRNQHCQLTARSFSEGSFLTFPALHQRHRLNIKLRFATRSRDGLLLYNGRYNERHDFIALEVLDGQVRFSFSVGSGAHHVTGHVPGGVSDGNWHQVELDYHNRTATIIMDGCDSGLSLMRAHGMEKYQCANRTTFELERRCHQQTEFCQRFIDLTGPLQIGGLPSLPTKFQVQSQHFSGCIQDVFIDHKLLDLDNYVANNSTVAGCSEKQRFCASHPCQNGGTCTEGWGTYVCRCQDTHAGKNCALDAETPHQLRGDGHISYISRIQAVTMPWYSGLAFRTRSADALLMKLSFGDGLRTRLMLRGGYIEYHYPNDVAALDTVRVNDGQWHHVLVKWMQGEVWINLDYGNHELTQAGDAQLAGLYVDEVIVGGGEGDVPGLIGCIREVRVGNSANTSLTLEEAVRANTGCSAADECVDIGGDVCPERSTCLSSWGGHECVCQPGHVGSQCAPVCELQPCSNNATCVADPTDRRGYSCRCQTPLDSGAYCEARMIQPCPSKWWGDPVCGPCHCDTEKGYDSDCDKKTGECRCKESHFRPPGSEVCFPCLCDVTGSSGRACDPLTGQCPCKNGVIGRRCDSCSHPFAEVTSRGCEVVYTGCPRVRVAGVLWQQTEFDATAVQPCPTGAEGEARRVCDRETGWAEPDLSECLSISLRQQEHQVRSLLSGALRFSSFLSVNTAADLAAAARSAPHLYVTDVYYIYKLLRLLLQHESNEAGLNLAHRQDRDFIPNLLAATSIILQPKYKRHWEKIQNQLNEGASDLLEDYDQYAHTLVRTQQDTFTDPMEIATDNVVLGLDTVSWRQLHGSATDGRVQLPAGAAFLETNSPAFDGPSIVLPKHNNYPRSRVAWDDHNAVLLPLKLLGIEAPVEGTTADGGPAPHQQAAVAYVLFRTLTDVLPERYADDVRRRWGVAVSGQSAALTLAVSDADGQLPAGEISTPVRLMLRTARLSAKSSPQCVRWQHEKGGPGQWTRQGCQTTFLEPWEYSANYTYVNCTCSHLSTFAVLMDDPSAEFLIETTPAENVVTYIGLLASIALLLVSFFIFSVLRGGLQTNSNSIHKNLALCLFCAQLIFLTALKLRQRLVISEFPCKLVAILLHYLWLSAFSWLLLESVHVHRMLTELRDVNHGAMRFYYSLGYGVPAIIVGLSVGVRADQYGNISFCWLSVHESVIWAMVGPVCALATATLVTQVLAIRASLSLKDHVEGFGNLRSLLWLSVALLPLMVAVWLLAVLSVSEEMEVLNFLLAVCSLLLGAYILLGYCLLNRRVRQGTARSLALCCGKKVTYDESLAGTRTTMASRSALSYHHDDILRRTVGISTASTTSRSTCKTSSSPYSLGINAPSTTSNSQPTSSTNDLRHAGSRRSAKGRRSHRARRDSDSESDQSDARRSLSLASSHSSDEEEIGNGSVSSPAARLRVEQRASGRGQRAGRDLSWRCSPPPPAPDDEHIYQEALSVTGRLELDSPTGAGTYSTPWRTGCPAELPAYPRYTLVGMAGPPAGLSWMAPPGLADRLSGGTGSDAGLGAPPPIPDESPEALPEPAPNLYSVGGGAGRLADLVASARLPPPGPLHENPDSDPVATISAPSYV